MQNENTWKSEFARAFRDLATLYSFLGWELPAQLSDVTRTYPVFIPYRLAERIRHEGAQGVLARQFLPAMEELHESGSPDPIGDRARSRAPQLIHRYDSRALFTPTSICPVQCRYCFRKNELSPDDELFRAEFASTLAYLRDHTEITEIIFTGGDPFTLSNERLSFYLESFANLDHIKDVRFHTRYPVVMPERFENGLLAVLETFASRFRTFTIAVHVNHPLELDEAARVGLRSLAQLPLQLLSQTVLLHGVNNDPATLLELFDKLIEEKVRPYYLHHPDRVKGGMHFYLPLEEGRQIYAGLRSKLPGWAIPQYVVDVPGGEGKVPAFNPESFAFSGSLLSLSGKLTAVPEP